MARTILPLMLVGTLLLTEYAQASTKVDWEAIKTSRGDRLPDFSFCGYHGSDKSLPSDTSTPLVHVSASNNDKTSEIQKALDKAAAAGGGVVELGPGTFKVSVGLTIASGTVLRGSGVETTELAVTELEVGVPLLTLGNSTNSRIKPSFISRITDDYVGIGAAQVTVMDASGFEAGQSVFVSRPATAKWIRANGMADLIRDGEKQTWIEAGTLIQQPRTIESVKGKEITLSIPLTDALDRDYMDAYVAAYIPPDTPSEMGVENLSIVLKPTCAGHVYDVEDPCNAAAIWMNPWTIDSFVRNVNMTGFNNGIDVQHNASRITIESVAFFRDRDTDRPGGYPTDINISGSQILIKDSGQYGRSTAKAFAVITQGRVPGPNAILRHRVKSKLQELYPHQRWATGLLVEDTNANVLFTNRWTAGSGQGWTMNGGVSWNTRGPINVQSPPLGINWAIGSTGDIDASANGTFIESTDSVSPRSLFSAQLNTRQVRHSTN